MSCPDYAATALPPVVRNGISYKESWFNGTMALVFLNPEKFLLKCVIYKMISCIIHSDSVHLLSGTAFLLFSVIQPCRSLMHPTAK
jgi:hypothetical protein